MRVLFISGELIGADVCHRLKKEGCEIKLYIKDKTRKDCFDGIVEKTKNWKQELKWVGKDGLIVIDDVIFGKIADKLRSLGYQVFGGSIRGDKLERERNYAQKYFSICGMKIAESIDFNDIDDAINFVEEGGGEWVVKQNGHDASLTYIGTMKDGSDVVSILNSYKLHNKSKDIKKISLQKKIDGVEIAIARYFNGTDWVGPIFVSFEHKSLLDGDAGPLTAEMGTLAWHDLDENNKVFKETLGKLKPYLREIGYRGYADINSIANQEGIFPLEATMRFGSPTNHMQSDMYLTSWNELLMAVAKGEQCELKVKEGYTIVVSLAIPPFPLKTTSSNYYIKGYKIIFKDELTKEEMDRIHFEEVCAKKNGEKTEYFVAGSNGYVMFVTGSGETVEKARENVYTLVSKIVLPKMIYRKDIGLKYMQKDKDLLKKWGWI